MTDKQRVLATIAAIPLGAGVGFVIGVLIIGAPHAFPGPLLHKPDSLRYTVLNTVMAVTPLVFIGALWVGPIRRMFSGDGVHAPPRVSAEIETADLSTAFRKKSTPELEAILKTRAQSIYPARTYQLAEVVLKERRTSEER